MLRGRLRVSLGQLLMVPVLLAACFGLLAAARGLRAERLAPRVRYARLDGWCRFLLLAVERAGRMEFQRKHLTTGKTEVLGVADLDVCDYVAVSAHGSRWAAASEGGSLDFGECPAIWRAADRDEEDQSHARGSSHRRWLEPFDISDDGSVAVLRTDDGVDIWDATRGVRKTTIPDSQTDALALSPDGRFVALGAVKGVPFEVRNTSLGILVKNFEGGFLWPPIMDWSPVEDTILWTTEAHLHGYDCSGDTQWTQSLETPPGPGYCSTMSGPQNMTAFAMAVSPDGARVAVYTMGPPTITVCDVRSGEKLWEWPCPLAGEFGYYLEILGFSDSGHTLIVGMGDPEHDAGLQHRQLLLVDIGTGRMQMVTARMERPNTWLWAKFGLSLLTALTAVAICVYDFRRCSRCK